MSTANPYRPDLCEPGCVHDTPAMDAMREPEPEFGEDDPRVQHTHPYADELYLGGEG